VIFMISFVKCIKTMNPGEIGFCVIENDTCKFDDSFL
jgi:hypothetical protein